MSNPCTVIAIDKLKPTRAIREKNGLKYAVGADRHDDVREPVCTLKRLS